MNTHEKNETFDALKRISVRDAKNQFLATWNMEFADEFRLSERVFDEKILHADNLMSEVSFALVHKNHYVGMIVLKRSPKDDMFHVGLIHVKHVWRRKNIATRMLRETMDKVTEKKPVIFVTGTEADCLLSGVPTESGRTFFEALGFKKTKENMNLIAHHQPSAIKAPDDDVTIRRAKHDDDKRMVHQINREHFSIRWANEVNESDPYDIFVLRKNGSIIGYVRTGFPDGPVIPYSVNFHDAYECLGGIGPLGLLPTERGHGYGRYMVNYALRALFDAGASDVMVDWTSLKTFYRKCGFEAVHSRYVVYEKRSDD